MYIILTIKLTTEKKKQRKQDSLGQFSVWSCLIVEGFWSVNICDNPSSVLILSTTHYRKLSQGESSKTEKTILSIEYFCYSE